MGKKASQSHEILAAIRAAKLLDFAYKTHLFDITGVHEKSLKAQDRSNLSCVFFD